MDSLKATSRLLNLTGEHNIFDASLHDFIDVSLRNNTGSYRKTLCKITCFRPEECALMPDETGDLCLDAILNCASSPKWVEHSHKTRNPLFPGNRVNNSQTRRSRCSWLVQRASFTNEKKQGVWYNLICTVLCRCLQLNLSHLVYPLSVLTMFVLSIANWSFPS